jgi:hypothetical protein
MPTAHPATVELPVDPGVARRVDRTADARAFDVFGSLIDDRPAVFERLRAAVRAHAARMTDEEKTAAHEVLYADLFSEFDARFLSDHVRALDVELSPEFWRCQRAWADDEELHYRVFRTVYGAVFDRDDASIDAEMNARKSGVSFEPLADLFEDEFSIACLLAYDELATVRAYRSSAPAYARLGPVFEEFIGLVTADEGRHFRNFLKLIRTRHAHRLGEKDRVIERIRATEGVPYANTFVLDHDDAVWSDRIFDESADVLRRHLHI